MVSVVLKGVPDGRDTFDTMDPQSLPNPVPSFTPRTHLPVPSDPTISRRAAAQAPLLFSVSRGTSTCSCTAGLWRSEPHSQQPKTSSHELQLTPTNIAVSVPYVLSNVGGREGTKQQH